MRLSNKICLLTRLICSGEFSELHYLLRRRLKKLDLATVSVERLGLSEDYSFAYCDSGGPALKQILEKIDLPKRSSVLDIGSGKGGAAITLGESSFLEVVGVEISSELVRVAQANVARLGLENVRFLCHDAAGFTDLDRFDFIYMYNPFTSLIMDQVMVNLACSLARRPRRLTLLYRNPVCHMSIMAAQLFEIEKDYKARNLNDIFRVYVHKA